MTDDSFITNTIGYAIIIYALIGLAPLLFEQTSVFYPTHSSLIVHQFNEILGLFNPLDNPVATLFSLVGGILITCLKKR